MFATIQFSFFDRSQVVSGTKHSQGLQGSIKWHSKINKFHWFWEEMCRPFTNVTKTSVLFILILLKPLLRFLSGKTRVFQPYPARVCSPWVLGWLLGWLMKGAMKGAEWWKELKVDGFSHSNVRSSYCFDQHIILLNELIYKNIVIFRKAGVCKTQRNMTQLFFLSLMFC